MVLDLKLVLSFLVSPLISWLVLIKLVKSVITYILVEISSILCVYSRSRRLTLVTPLWDDEKFRPCADDRNLLVNSMYRQPHGPSLVLRATLLTTFTLTYIHEGK